MHTRHRFALALVVASTLLSACVATVGGAPPARIVADGDRFTLQVGEQVGIAGGGRLHYASLASDSRCPPDVQCVWAGVAEIALRWTPASGAAQDFRLKTDAEGNSRIVGPHRVTLVALERGGAPPAEISLAAAR